MRQRPSGLPRLREAGLRRLRPGSLAVKMAAVAVAAVVASRFRGLLTASGLAVRFLRMVEAAMLRSVGRRRRRRRRRASILQGPSEPLRPAPFYGALRASMREPRSIRV